MKRTYAALSMATKEYGYYVTWVNERWEKERDGILARLVRAGDLGDDRDCPVLAVWRRKLTYGEDYQVSATLEYKGHNFESFGAYFTKPERTLEEYILPTLRFDEEEKQELEAAYAKLAWADEIVLKGRSVLPDSAQAFAWELEAVFRRYGFKPSTSILIEPNK